MKHVLIPQGGIHGKISLTAYVVAALLETGINTEVSSHTKRVSVQSCSQFALHGPGSVIL